jgi:hypothetical protein
VCLGEGVFAYKEEEGVCHRNPELHLKGGWVGVSRRAQCGNEGEGECLQAVCVLQEQAASNHGRWGGWGERGRGQQGEGATVAL